MQKYKMVLQNIVKHNTEHGKNIAQNMGHVAKTCQNIAHNVEGIIHISWNSADNRPFSELIKFLNKFSVRNYFGPMRMQYFSSLNRFLFKLVNLF